jgi:hypothetical protein
MSLVSVTYASSPSSDLLIPTLEFNNETAGVIRLAQSFNDVTATTELDETVTFIESAWEVSLPNKDGQKVYTTDVVVENAEFAESKSAASGNAGGFAPADRPAPSQAAGDGFMNIPDGIDEELPFN